MTVRRKQPARDVGPHIQHLAWEPKFSPIFAGRLGAQEDWLPPSSITASIAQVRRVITYKGRFSRPGASDVLVVARVRVLPDMSGEVLSRELRFRFVWPKAGAK